MAEAHQHQQSASDDEDERRMRRERETLTDGMERKRCIPARRSLIAGLHPGRNVPTAGGGHARQGPVTGSLRLGDSNYRRFTGR